MVSFSRRRRFISMLVLLLLCVIQYLLQNFRYTYTFVLLETYFPSAIKNTVMLLFLFSQEYLPNHLSLSFCTVCQLCYLEGEIKGKAARLPCLRNHEALSSGNMGHSSWSFLNYISAATLCWQLICNYHANFSSENYWLKDTTFQIFVRKRSIFITNFKWRSSPSALRTSTLDKSVPEGQYSTE